jgi:hypothetical protein
MPYYGVCSLVAGLLEGGGGAAIPGGSVQRTIKMNVWNELIFNAEQILIYWKDNSYFSEQHNQVAVCDDIECV